MGKIEKIAGTAALGVALAGGISESSEAKMTHSMKQKQIRKEVKSQCDSILTVDQLTGKTVIELKKLSQECGGSVLNTLLDEKVRLEMQASNGPENQAESDKNSEKISKIAGSENLDFNYVPINHEEEKVREEKIKAELASLEKEEEKVRYQDYLDILGEGYEDEILKLVKNPKQIEKSKKILAELNYGDNDFLALIVTIGKLRLESNPKMKNPKRLKSTQKACDKYLLAILDTDGTYSEKAEEKLQKYYGADILLGLSTVEGSDFNRMVKARKSIAELQESIDVSQESIDVSQESIDASQESIDASQESIDVSQESIDASQESIDASQESIDASQESIDTSQESIDAENRKQKKLDEIINKLGSIVAKN